VRVASIWSGQTWGGVHIPRVGQEVIVAFEDGDPDKPIIVGSVYNATNMPPYKLPDNKTQSGIKSRSTLQGDATMSNELRFEDKKQNEDVFFHAQKDFHRVVENDDDLKVNHDQTITIKNNRTETISEGNESVTITKGKRDLKLNEGNDSVTLDKGNSSLTITEGNETVSIAKGTRTVSVKSDDSLTVEGKRTVTVTQDRSVTVSQGNDSLTVSQGNGSITISQGNLTISVSAGSCSVSAMNSIELKVGSNSVQISTTGVTIKGAQVQLQGTATAQVQAPMTTIKADTALQLQGTITKIG
jgi:type VI secretion system secreted protein VgrG